MPIRKGEADANRNASQWLQLDTNNFLMSISKENELPAQIQVNPSKCFQIITWILRQQGAELPT